LYIQPAANKLKINLHNYTFHLLECWMKFLDHRIKFICFRKCFLKVFQIIIGRRMIFQFLKNGRQSNTKIKTQSAMEKEDALVTVMLMKVLHRYAKTMFHNVIHSEFFFLSFICRLWFLFILIMMV
jgi:hypothetical protein